MEALDYAWRCRKTQVMDFSLEFPIIPHESAGLDCCGCIVVRVQGNDAELVCNECGAVVGVVNSGILADLVSLVKPAPRGE
jgi:hypothetical protein